MKIKPLVTAVFTFVAASLNAATYWVATNGYDSNDGLSSNTPFATPQFAVTYSSLAAGDTIYVRGGTYSLSAQVKPSRAGSAGGYIKFWAYPGELPVFDFGTMPTGGSTKALDLRKNYWHVKGIEVKNAPDSGIFIGAYSNVVEGCVVHDCNNDGIILGSTSTKTTNALILNCDSYRNYQAGSFGNNGDGFAAKSGCDVGNVFRGCRSWYNADDGWDFYANNAYTVTLENCWSFCNGTNLWGVGSWQGNGNGFKLGGAGTLASHVLKNCMAFDNWSKGFDHNGSLGAHTLYNCTGFRNTKWNFSFYAVPSSGSNAFKNDLAYLGLGGTNNIAQPAVMVSNSWQGFAVTAADFVSLDLSLAFAPRNADYSLPTNGLGRLAAGSQLIDKGVDVGLPYNGIAPDLGAYEFSASPQGPISFDTSTSNLQMTNGGFVMQVNGLTAHGPVVFYASTALTNWQAIYTNPPTSGSVQFADPAATNFSWRYYRAEER